MSTRRRQERMRIVRRRLLVALLVALLGSAAMAQGLRAQIAGQMMRLTAAVQSAATMREAQITLPEMNVYALQLGAFDSGERAKSEQNRLMQAGVSCILWQRRQMRLVCDASMQRHALSGDAAQGHDAWVIEDVLPEVVLRAQADAAAMDDVRALLEMPDALFAALCEEAKLVEIVDRMKPEVQRALEAHPAHELYTQLAQSLVNWCALMENANEKLAQEEALAYARVTMCTLCYELRQALIAQAQSEASTASAQRTPSTAADVMPPA